MSQAEQRGERRARELVATPRGDGTEDGQLERAGVVHRGQKRMKAARLEHPGDIARLRVQVGEGVLEASRHKGGVACGEVDVASPEAAAQGAREDDDVFVLVVVDVQRRPLAPGDALVPMSSGRS
jgi:hypothetical protein